MVRVRAANEEEARAANEEEAHAAIEQDVVHVVLVGGRRVVVVVAVADELALPLADADAVDTGSTTRTMPS